MKVFIQYKGAMPFNINAFSAQSWFIEMGYEIIPFQSISDIENQLDKEAPVIGGIGTVLAALEKLGCPKPKVIDIPECLLPFAKRKIWTSTLGEAKRHEENWPVFIKPLTEHKFFTGHVLKDFRDLFKTLGIPETTKVLCSEPVNITSEYRGFVLHGELLDIRRYTGSLDFYPDLNVVREIIKSFKDAPCAYSVDVGCVLGHTVLIEVNDAYSLGIYGLHASSQVKMLIARWKEMTNDEIV